MNSIKNELRARMTQTTKLLLILILALSSLIGCASPRPAASLPCDYYWTQFNQPAMEKVVWTHEDSNKKHCLSSAEAKKLLNNLDAKDAYIKILEQRLLIVCSK